MSLKSQPLTEEQKIIQSRLDRAILLMDEDADLRLLRDDWFAGQANALEGEALKALKGEATSENAAEARACAKAAEKIRDFRNRLITMAADQKKKEAASPKPAAS